MVSLLTGSQQDPNTAEVAAGPKALSLYLQGKYMVIAICTDSLPMSGEPLGEASKMYNRVRSTGAPSNNPLGRTDRQGFYRWLDWQNIDRCVTPKSRKFGMCAAPMVQQKHK